MRKGSEFEAAIVEYLSSKTAVLTVAQSRDEIRDLAAAEQTIEALAETVYCTQARVRLF